MGTDVGPGFTSQEETARALRGWSVPARLTDPPRVQNATVDEALSVLGRDDELLRDILAVGIGDAELAGSDVLSWVRTREDSYGYVGFEHEGGVWFGVGTTYGGKLRVGRTYTR
jgi:hypothetical protein